MTKVEAAIQRALVDWFKKTYPEFMLMGTLNENSRYNIEMGVVVGLTDLLIFARKDDILHVFYNITRFPQRILVMGGGGLVAFPRISSRKTMISTRLVFY